jgi:hypothetical protein
MKIDQSATISNYGNHGLAEFILLCGASEVSDGVAANINQFGSIIDYWLNQG